MKPLRPDVTGLSGRVLESIQRWRLLPAGETVVVAVSGGLDSTVLLRLLHGLAERLRWRLVVAHFNHCLRGAEAEADAVFVRRLARRLSLPFVGGSGEVRQLARRQGISIEMAARRLRHEFLAATAAEQGSCRVALAHHAGDQVETFFLRLRRGSGGAGLAGMRPDAPSPARPEVCLVRPLLEIPRAELAEFARRHRLRWREDASNQAADAERNRLRLTVLPWLRKRFNAALDAAVQRTMVVVGAEAALAAELAGGWLADDRRIDFDQLHVAVQRRVILSQLVARGFAPGFEVIERLRQEVGTPLTLKPGVLVWRETDGRLRTRPALRRPFDDARRAMALSGVRGVIQFESLRVEWRFRARRGPWQRGRSVPGPAECFDADRIGATVILRHWQPGDRFQPIGLSSSAKLQDLFTNKKVPSAERHGRVVATTVGGDLFWVEGLRIGEEFKVRPDTCRRLEWGPARVV